MNRFSVARVGGSQACWERHHYTPSPGIPAVSNSAQGPKLANIFPILMDTGISPEAILHWQGKLLGHWGKGEWHATAEPRLRLAVYLLQFWVTVLGPS